MKTHEIPYELVVVINGFVWMEALRYIKLWNIIASERPEIRRFDSLEDEARQLWRDSSVKFEVVNSLWPGPTLLTPNEHLTSLQNEEYTPDDWVDFSVSAFESERTEKGVDWYGAMFRRYFEGDLSEAVRQVREVTEPTI